MTSKTIAEGILTAPLGNFPHYHIGGLLPGVTGMIIAVPGYMTIKVVLKEFFNVNKIVKSLTKNL